MIEQKTKIKFHILAILCIIIFCFAITPITLQNDTYYTIKIGEHILENGIDGQDPFSWHENLPYTYPHWAYDVGTYLVYQIGGFTGIYVVTVILTMLLGILLYIANLKISKNCLTSFFITIGAMYLLKGFVAARAQLVTFCIFVLTILWIESFIKTKKKRYAIGLILNAIIIANVHIAVWPFFFVLFLPYIAEYLLCLFMDSNIIYKVQNKFNKRRLRKMAAKNKHPEKIEKLTKKIDEIQYKIAESNFKREELRKNPYRIKMEKKPMVKWLILVLVICTFTGLLTPLGDAPYTYLVKTMEGNTTQSINEHLPLVLINDKGFMIVLALFLLILIFTDTKIGLADLFMLGGLVVLAFMARRQISMLVLICSFILNKLIVAVFEKYDEGGTAKFVKLITTWLGRIFTLLLVILMGIAILKPKAKDKIIDESAYPVKAADYILENIDIENMKLFNEYNYGSYLLYRGIPVFIDSRADLYAPEFNGTKKEDGTYEGKDIFSDCINISNLGTYYEDKFDGYGITHVITYKNSRLNMFLSRDEKYKELYSDEKFILYHREVPSET